MRLNPDMARVLDVMEDGRIRSAAEVGNALGMEVRIVSGIMRSAERRGYLTKTGKRRTRKMCATLYRIKRRAE